MLALGPDKRPHAEEALNSYSPHSLMKSNTRLCGHGARPSPAFKDAVTVPFLTAIVMPLPTPYFLALLTPPCQPPQDPHPAPKKGMTDKGHRRTVLSAICSEFLICHPLPLL